MNRSALARRYAPLLAVAAIQLLIIAAVPSTAGKQTQLSTGFGNSDNSLSAGAGPDQAGAAGGAGGDAAGGAAAGGTAGGAASAGGGARAGTGGAAGTGAAGGAGLTAASGDTSHCAKGRTFDPALAYFAPPCVAGTPGAPMPNNGGNTYQGVTKDTITIIDYITNYGAEVNAILQAQGQLETYDQGKVMDAAFETFLNKHFVTYGRHIKLITYQGKCTSVPPDKQCLIPEMDNIVDTYHPYMVFWNTTLCSECFAELRRKNTVAVGGIGFSEQFAQANAPFYYSAGESSSRMEIGFSQFWCNQLQNSPVKFAGTQNAAQNFNGQKRVLGIISTNDPDNEDTVNKVLVPLLKQCGQNVNHFYFYDQNINTAATQVQAGIAAMNTAQNAATTVLCLCDSVAPAFVYQGEQNNNYNPENVLADVQGMGWDQTGQSYEDDGGNPSLGCPHPDRGCPYDNAFGLLADGPQEPQETGPGVRVFHDGGGKDPMPVTAITATPLAQQMVMMAGLIQATGPNLNPKTMHDAAPRMGTVGGGASGDPMLGFVRQANGDINYNWQLDARIVYWDKTVPSPYNQKPGKYISIEGSRFDVGGYPNMDNPPVTRKLS